jgi:hypothetical protein
VLVWVTLMVPLASPIGAQTLTWQQAADEAVRDAVAASEVPGAVLVVGQGAQVLHRRSSAGARPFRDPS